MKRYVEALRKERLNPLCENAPEFPEGGLFPGKKEAHRHHVDGFPGKGREDPVRFGREDRRHAGRNLRRARPAPERIQTNAPRGEGRMKFIRRLPPGSGAGGVDRASQALARFGIDHDHRIPAQNRLSDERGEHDALPCLGGADEKCAAPEAPDRPLDRRFLRPHAVKNGASDFLFRQPPVFRHQGPD